MSTAATTSWIERAVRFGTAVAVSAGVARGAAAADIIELRRILPGDRPGVTGLLIDRGRISSITSEQAKGPAYEIRITIDPEPKPRFVVRCLDLATARSVTDLLAGRTTGPLDVTGRCEF